MDAAKWFILYLFIFYSAAYISEKSIKDSRSCYIFFFFGIHFSPAAQVCKHLLSVWHSAAEYFQIMSQGKKQNKKTNKTKPKNKASAWLSVSTQLLTVHEYSRSVD